MSLRVSLEVLSILIMSVLMFVCSTAFGNVLSRENGKFLKLFKRKAMLHHYTVGFYPLLSFPFYLYFARNKGLIERNYLYAGVPRGS